MTAAAPLRPAQWPWVVLAGFLAIAGVAMVLVVANDEAVAEQIPYVIAFAMFGVVGAFIVSRDRRNRIGILFLWASFITAISFLSELLTYVVNNGSRDGGSSRSVPQQLRWLLDPSDAVPAAAALP
jgi:FtsH-binding integral membrane protein